MKNILSSLFVILALFTQAKVVNNTAIMDKKYVELTGVAEMEIIPKELYVNITLQEEKDGMKISVEELEDILIKTLKKLDVDLKNLKLSNLESNTYWDKKTKESFKQKSFELKLNDAGKASEVLHSLNNLEIYRINVGKTDHSEIEKYRKQVKIDAVIEGIEDDIFIVEQDNNNYAGYRTMSVSNVLMSDGAYSPNPEVEFKPITLKYKILARFEIN
ncbi:MAG: hypothetical protein ACI89M_001942 [Chitinophagales bacterium]|jgi:hypothetical protein